LLSALDKQQAEEKTYQLMLELVMLNPNASGALSVIRQATEDYFKTKAL